MNDQIKKAMTYAQQAHMAQTYDGYPYFKHLEDVYKVLIEYGFKEDEDLPVLQAAWLHDILEDTARSWSDLKKNFSEEVAEIVYCVTDELARTRKEKKEKTLSKIRSNIKSVVVKVADRIANVRHSKLNDSSKFAMYQKEQEEFQQSLRIYKHIDNMWNDLNKLLETTNA
jgi:(p)ppGpp synthase/HD superfamily hydrolase